MGDIRKRSGYMLKDSIVEKIREKYRLDYIANQVGISLTYMSLIMNKQKHCSKLTAYAITKTLNSDAEIEDYFERI